MYYQIDNCKIQLDGSISSFGSPNEKAIYLSGILSELHKSKYSGCFEFDSIFDKSKVTYYNSCMLIFQNEYEISLDINNTLRFSEYEDPSNEQINFVNEFVSLFIRFKRDVVFDYFYNKSKLLSFKEYKVNDE